MKKILYLAKKEALLLKKSIILIVVVLTVFLAAFMGIFSVRLNFINSFFETLDKENFTYYAGAYRINLDEAKKLCGGGLYVGEKRGITEQATIYNTEGHFLKTEFRNDEIFAFFHGACVVADDTVKTKFSTADVLIEGGWLDGDNQIVIDKFIAEYLAVGAGDIVTVGDYEFTVKGVYDGNALEHDYFFNYYFYLTLGGAVQMSEVKKVTSDAHSAYSAYKKLAGKGYEPLACNAASDYFYTIPPVEITLGILAVIILAIIILIIYTLLMIFYRQRKQFICILKILGADGFTAAAVYLILIFGILLISVLLATALGMAFNQYFMNLCESIFQLPFTLGFNFWVSPAALLISCIIAVFVYLISALKTKSATLAIEIRCE